MSPLQARYEELDDDQAYESAAGVSGKNWDISSKAKMVRAARHRRNQGKAKLFNGAHLRRNSKRPSC